MPLPSRAAAATAAAPPQTRAPKCARRRAASGGEVSCLAVHARRSGGGGCRSRAVSGLLRCMRAVRSSRDGSRAPSPQPRLHSKGRRAPSRDRGCRARGRGSRSVESALRRWRARGDTCSESPPPQTHAPSTRAVAARRAAAPSAFRVDEQMRRNRRDLPSISVMPSFACRTLWISAVHGRSPAEAAPLRPPWSEALAPIRTYPEPRSFPAPLPNRLCAALWNCRGAADRSAGDCAQRGGAGT